MRAAIGRTVVSRRPSNRSTQSACYYLGGGGGGIGLKAEIPASSMDATRDPDSALCPASCARACVVSAQPVQKSTKSATNTTKRTPLRDILRPSNLGYAFSSSRPVSRRVCCPNALKIINIFQKRKRNFEKVYDPGEVGKEHLTRREPISGFRRKYSTEKPKMQTISLSQPVTSASNCILLY